jgi:GNAT superfamily N-acetyltransferase
LRLVREDFARQGVGNLEAIELGLREALLKDGRRLLEELLDQAQQHLAENTSHPGEKCHPGRVKQVRTIFGNIKLRRRYFYDADQEKGRAPLDEALGLVNGFSPALVRLSARAAARQGYEAASQDLQALAGIQIEGRQIQRLVNGVAPQVAAQLEAAPAAKPPVRPVMYVEVDGTGVPMVAAELAGRKGKQPDGTAKTREVKLGAIFTQTRGDEEGRPERDFASTTYVGSFESAEPFGLRVRAEARRRGIGQAQKVVFIGDGAAWIWELCRRNFAGAIEILDLYHALEHLHRLCEGLYPGQKRWAVKMEEAWTEQIKNDEITEVIAAARRRLKQLGPQAEGSLETQIAYFEHHQQRMLYQTYRKAGLFCGSGVVEAGCRAVIGQRLKNSGMFWTETGGKSILDLRCALQGNRWDECWNRLHNSDRFKIRAAA